MNRKTILDDDTEIELVDWSEYLSKQNTEEVLREKAFSLAIQIVSAVYNQFNKIKDTQKEGRNKELDGISLLNELCIAYLHTIDRRAFQAFSHKERGIFMSFLATCVLESIARDFEKQGWETTEYKKRFNKLYNLRFEEYSKYKLEYPEKSADGMKDTLFWEMSKVITNKANLDEFESLFIGMDILGIITYFNLPELFYGIMNEELRKRKV